MIRGCLLLMMITVLMWFPSAYKRWTHAFRLAKCTISWPSVPEWNTSPADADIIRVLERPFFYLDKGAQSYVFESQDKKYVLKVFRFDSCKIPFGQQTVRTFRKKLGLRQKHFLPLEDTIRKNFASCHLAYRFIPKQTGVEYVHLNPGSQKLSNVTLVDRLGRSHILNPNLYRFIVQKKAERLTTALRRSSKQDAEALLQSYLILLQELTAAGINNLDATMGPNFGVCEGRVIQLDVGNFSVTERGYDEAHFQQKMRSWLERNMPERVAFFTRNAAFKYH